MLYSSFNIIKVSMRWAWHIAHRGGTMNAYKILTEI